MELKYVIPNMEQTFGNLEYAGEGQVEQRRMNGEMTTLSHHYNLYLDVQRADDIEFSSHRKSAKSFLNMKTK